MSRLELFSIRARVVVSLPDAVVLLPAQPSVRESSRSDLVMVERMEHLGEGRTSAACRSIVRIGPVCWLLFCAALAEPASGQTVVPRDTTRRTADTTRAAADTAARRPGDSLRTAA